MRGLDLRRGVACMAAFAGIACAGAHEARLPGARAAMPDEPFAVAQRIDVMASGPASLARAASGPTRGCETALRLPWGPIESCRTAIVAGALTATAAVSVLAWWSQGFDSRFNVAHEGAFGKDSYAGGIDKLGHAWSFYLATRLGARTLAWARLPQQDALRLAAGLGLGVGLGIEVLDGLSRGGRYGFSWQDLAMNAVGVGLGMLMESRPELDRYVAFRLMYSPGGRDDSLYDHQTYLLALRLSGLSAIGRDSPLRYLELVAGYGAKGFRSDGDYSQQDLRRRTAYLGVALNLTELLERTVFTGSARDGTSHRWTTEALRYLQPPGTAVAWQKHWRP